MGAIAWVELAPRKRRLSRQRRGVQFSKQEEEEEEDGEENDKGCSERKLTVREILQRIARKRAFVCLVAQGISGATPWDMMTFQLLLLEWRGFRLSGMLGGWMGGVLGDAANHRYDSRGRIFVALVSVHGGIPLYGLFLFATNFHIALVCINLFHFVATWTTAAALRPICADLARNPSERSQIVSLWIVWEKTSGAIFGAPLVG